MQWIKTSLEALTLIHFRYLISIKTINNLFMINVKVLSSENYNKPILWDAIIKNILLKRLIKNALIEHA